MIASNNIFDINGLLTKREVKLAGYWPSSFFAWLWTETKSSKLGKKKDLLYGIKHQRKICVLAGQCPYPERAR